MGCHGGYPHSWMVMENPMKIWLVVWNMFFSIYWECHHPIWRSHFFRGSKHQPAKIVVTRDFWGSTNWFWSTLPGCGGWTANTSQESKLYPWTLGWFWCCAAIRLSNLIHSSEERITFYYIVKQGTSLDSRHSSMLPQGPTVWSISTGRRRQAVFFVTTTHDILPWKKSHCWLVGDYT